MINLFKNKFNVVWEITSYLREYISRLKNTFFVTAWEQWRFNVELFVIYEQSYVILDAVTGMYKILDLF